MKCVVWTEKAVAQGTSQTGYPCRAIPLGWNAAPGLFLFKPFGQSCFGAWPALGTRTRAYRPGHLVPALPTGPNQSLRHASALLRQPLSRSIVLDQAEVRFFPLDAVDGKCFADTSLSVGRIVVTADHDLALLVATLGKKLAGRIA